MHVAFANHGCVGQLGSTQISSTLSSRIFFRTEVITLKGRNA